MSSTKFDELLSRMPEISKAVESFKSEAIQSQVLNALLGAFGHSDAQEIRPRGQGRQNDINDEPGSGSDAGNTAKKSQRKPSSSNAKQSFSIDKGLDFFNTSYRTLDAFVDEKKPSNQLENCLISVYWLTRIATEAEKATVERVYTCFKHMKWPVPANLPNTIAQAGVKGWLDSSNREDLKVVIAGENYVEHQMPIAKKSVDQK